MRHRRLVGYRSSRPTPEGCGRACVHWAPSRSRPIGPCLGALAPCMTTTDDARVLDADPTDRDSMDRAGLSTLEYQRLVLRKAGVTR